MEISDKTPAEMRARAQRYRSGLGLDDERILRALKKYADEYEALADRWEKAGTVDPPVNFKGEEPGKKDGPHPQV
ncbi:MAG: hypothetical protein V4587_09160 [Acidobacteriota bacterium]